MRPGIVIAIVGVLAVIGGYFWVSSQSSEQARVEQQDQAAQVARDAEAIATEQAAREAEEDATLTPDQTVAGAGEAEGGLEGAILIGDEITEDAIVVDSEGQPTILEPENTTTTASVIDDSAAGSETEGQAEDGVSGTVAAGADEATTAGADEAMAAGGNVADMTADAEQLLTPEAFDRDEVLALIDESEKLTDARRSTLRALVEGADANSSMMEGAIESIRAALDLPPLN